jgi:hypothetical protein
MRMDESPSVGLRQVEAAQPVRLHNADGLVAGLGAEVTPTVGLGSEVTAVEALAVEVDESTASWAESRLRPHCWHHLLH